MQPLYSQSSGNALRLNITKLISTLGFLFLPFCINHSLAQIKEVPYTLDDRDRMIRVEEQIKSIRVETSEQIKSLEAQIKSLKDETNIRFEAMNTKFEAIDDKINKLYTLIYFVLGGVFGLIGFVIYDRRTALAPVARDNRKLKEILYELAKTNPQLNDILNKAAI